MSELDTERLDRWAEASRELNQRAPAGFVQGECPIWVEDDEALDWIAEHAIDAGRGPQWPKDTCTKTAHTLTVQPSTATIYARAGLQNPEMFAIEAMRRNLGQDVVNMLGEQSAIEGVHRGTGRTTAKAVQCICEALGGSHPNEIEPSKQEAMVFLDAVRRVASMAGYEVSSETETTVCVGSGSVTCRW